MPNWDLIVSLLFPNVGGWVTAIMTMIGQVSNKNNDAWYERIKKPRWTPPNWVFGPIWIVLYTGMGYASYLVYEDCGGITDKAILPLALYGGQMILNWIWTPIFFGMHKIGLALFELLVLDVVATACAVSFFIVNNNTAYLMTPYLCWLAFATCLIHSIWELNKHESKTP